MDPDFKFKPDFLSRSPPTEQPKTRAMDVVKPTLVEKIKNNKLILVGIVVVLLVVIVVVIVSLVTKKPKPKPKLQPALPSPQGPPPQPGNIPQAVPQQQSKAAPIPEKPLEKPIEKPAEKSPTKPPEKPKSSFDNLIESVDDQELARHINSENKEKIAEPIGDDSDEDEPTESEGESLDPKEKADNF